MRIYLRCRTVLLVRSISDGFREHKLRYAHAGGKEQFNNSKITDAAAELIFRFCLLFLCIECRQKCLDRVEWDGFGQEFCFVEANIQFVKRIFMKQFPVLHIMEEGF